MPLRSLTSPLLVAALLLLAVASPARGSNGAQQVVVGSKGPVSLPIYGDAQNMFRMPSTIAWSLDHRIDLDLFWFHATSKMDNRLNDFEQSGGTVGASGGFVLAPGRPDFEAEPEAWDTYEPKRRFTFGVGVFPDLAGGGGEEARVRYTTYPETVETGKGILFINNTFTVAYTPTNWLALGASFHLIYASLSIKTTVGGDSTPLGGSPTINGVPFPGNPSYADFLNLFGNGQAGDPSTYFTTDLSGLQFSGTLSLSLRPHENLGIGLSYREKSFGPDFEGEAEVDARRTFDLALAGLDSTLRNLFLGTLPDGGQNGFTSEYDVTLRGIYVPRQVRLSVAGWLLDERLLLAGEIGWIEWHDAFDRTRVELEKGTNRDLNFVIGNPRVVSKLPLRWRNQWVFSLYGSFGVTDAFTVRAGFNYGRIPINEKYEENAPTAGFTSTHASVGVGYRLGSLELNFLLEHAFHDSLTSGFDATGDTAKNTRYSSKQWFFHLGAGYTF